MLDPNVEFVVVLLSGPPKVGKNMIGEELYEDFDICFSDLAIMDSPKAATLAMYGLAERGLTVADMEAIKDEPHEYFQGLSWRQAISNTAEINKLYYGRDFWAIQTVGRIKALVKEIYRLRPSKGKKYKTIIFVTDPSFPEDVETFEKLLPRQTILVRVHRGNRHFGKAPGYEQAYGVGTGADVRNWLFSDTLPSFDFVNDGTKRNARADLLIYLRDLINLSDFSMVHENKLILQTSLQKDFMIPQGRAINPFTKPYTILVPQLTIKE